MKFRRAILNCVETRALTDAEKAAGYVGALTGKIPYNSDSGVLRDRRLNNGQPFVERIAPKAFARSIADGKVMGMAGHTDDPLCAFGRAGANMTMTDGDECMRWDALVPNTTAGRDLVELVDKRILTGTSFEFDVGAKDTWEKRGDGTAVRTVTEGTLSAVNPVVWPAYDSSELSVSMRSRLRRGYWQYQDEDYANGDGNMTPDVAYAVAALGMEIAGLTEALDYLRDVQDAAPELAQYARDEVKECRTSAKLLVDFLAKNGDAVPAAALDRARAKLTESRAAVPDEQPATLSPEAAARERRLRELGIAPI